MSTALKTLIVTAGLTLALTASNANNNETNEQLQLDNLYVCSFWPTCRDPDEQKPAPSDTSVPKPTGDKDTTKDKKDAAQLA